ncbi:SDR family NAD(P)-dependent oxidoreductase [Nonomuraea sp. bgisy101]|uniref:SDR family NAD(P)-dependent oxidoreductase n=1 Tax=Nonomuraea sp. bgisy101 TaxID=3413784 RepID=UPI003D765D61
MRSIIRAVQRDHGCRRPDAAQRTGPPGSGEEDPASGVVRCFGERPVPYDEPVEESGALVEPSPGELLAAARGAVAEGSPLIVAARNDAYAGFLRSLWLEHPELAVGLVMTTGDVVTPVGPGPGYHELSVDERGGVWRRESVPLELPEGEIPLGPDDVVLVSGGGKGFGHACAKALGEATGARLALFGRSEPDDDPALAADLGALTTDYAYEPADLGDSLAVAHAVRALEERLGQVTAIVHAGGVNRPARFSELKDGEIALHVAPKVGGLEALLAVVERPRLVVTFGSAAGRYGRACGSHVALANGLMRDRARKAGSLARRVLTIEWGSEGRCDLFLRLLAVPDLSGTVSVRTGEDPHPQK